ncbi:MAG: alpha-hydroxy acid oxidase [Pseudomonadota bacterium]
MDLHQSYPAIADLRDRARRRIPGFVWDFLDSGTGNEATLHRNRSALDNVLLRPATMQGLMTPDLTTTFMGRKHPLPVGIAPVGMSGLIWADAERHLARFAAKADVPYTLSNVAAQTPEVVGKVAQDAWFQLYPAKDIAIRDDIVDRARDSGFKTLVITVDVPAASRRERQTRGGLTQPPRITPRIALQCAMNPAWTLGFAGRGKPRLKTIEKYATTNSKLPSNQHIGYLIRGNPDWPYLESLRAKWDGPLVVKGIMDPGEAIRCKNMGVDAVWVSNHAGRQFAGSMSSIESLPEVRAHVGEDYPLIFDSGVEGGLDILRAIALGADFVMLGRAWHFALAALGPRGLPHLLDILTADMVSNMAQIGIERPVDAKARLVS